MRQNGNYGNLKTYLDAKFQLILPSNEARTSKWAKKYVFVSGHLGNLKNFLDTKFQLIWPSDEASNHFRSLWGGKVNIPDHF